MSIIVNINNANEVEHIHIIYTVINFGVLFIIPIKVIYLHENTYTKETLHILSDCFDPKGAQ